jgi:DNA invertase Pin-like site-specific DNA recombinase
MLKERTRHGLEAARLEGRVGGRKPSLTPQQTKEAVAMVTSGQKSGAEVARLFKVHPATVSRVVTKARLVQ